MGLCNFLRFFPNHAINKGNEKKVNLRNYENFCFILWSGTGFDYQVFAEFSQKDYSFAFLVHPRNTADIYKKYPFFKYFPDKFTDWAFRHFWPVVVSEIEGVKSVKSGKNIRGFILTVPLTAKQMLEDRDFAVKRIIDTIKLAEKLGAKNCRIRRAYFIFDERWFGLGG